MDYYSPSTVEEALSILAKYGEAAIPIAGCSFFMAHKDEAYSDVKVMVDIRKIGLKYIKVDKDGLKVGATTTLTDIVESEITNQGEFSVITEAAMRVKPVEIRNVATMGAMLTIGAELDLPTLLITMNAKLSILNPAGESRSVPLNDFYIGYLATALTPGELLVEIQIPHLSAGTGVAFEKFERRAVDLAVINAASRVTLGPQGKCTEVKIVIGGAAVTPIRLTAAEEMLVGNVPDNDLITQASKEAGKLETVTDIRATAKVRQRWAEVAVKRTLAEACQRATRGI